MRISFLRFMVLVSPLFLAACGEGWEMVRVTDIGAYGSDRTAGSGIMYVRARLAPPQDLKIVNVKRDYEPEIIEDLRAMFDAKQRK